MDKYRKATHEDLPAVLNLIEDGFSVQGDEYSNTEGKEHRLLFSHLYSRPEWSPDWLYLIERDNQIVAAAGCFPQVLNFEGVTIPVWAVSPVVTDTKYRGQRLARKCLENMLADLRKAGIPAVFLWGLPSYYPQLDFVPILPRYKTKINLKQFKDIPEQIQGKLRLSSFFDMEAVANIYKSYDSKLWLQPQRDLKWWQQRWTEMDIEFADIKEVPFPHKEQFLIWENSSGRIAGYLHFKVDSQQKITITESLPTSLNEAIFLLRSFISKYLKPDQTLYIQGTPEHPLNMAAYKLGGINLNPAPLAGMVKVIDWNKFFFSLAPLLEKRLTRICETDWQRSIGDAVHFIYQKQIGLKIKVEENAVLTDKKYNGLLTRLILGLYNNLDLELADLNREDQFFQIPFPQKYPFIWDANYLY